MPIHPTFSISNLMKKSFQLDFKRFFVFALGLQCFYYVLLLVQTHLYLKPIELWLKEFALAIEQNNLIFLQQLNLPDAFYFFSLINVFLGLLSMVYLAFTLYDEALPGQKEYRVQQILLMIVKKLPAFVAFHILQSMVHAISPYFFGLPYFLFSIFFSLTGVYLLLGNRLIFSMKMSLKHVQTYRLQVVLIFFIFYLLESSLLFSLQYNVFSMFWPIVYFILTILYFAKLKFLVVFVKTIHKSFSPLL